MMRMRAVALAVCLGLGGLAVVGCEPYQNTRVGRGQLATVGNPTYDELLKKVHAEQVGAEGWNEQRRDNRKALVTSLGLLPHATKETILSAIRARVKSSSVAAVPEVDTCAKGELERADKVLSRVGKYEELAKEADALRPGVPKDYPTDASKRRDAENELAASAYKMRELVKEAEEHAREARKFAEDLGQTVGAQFLPKQAPAPEPAPSAPTQASASAAPAKKPPPKAAPKPAPKPAGDPKPAPKPAPKPSGEDFTP